MAAELLYSRIFKSLERERWSMATDVPWDAFDAAKLTAEQARTIKMNAITEWSALPATEMFLRDNSDDTDFAAFMSVWFYEEQKHALALIEYLARFCPEHVPTEDELAAVRFPFDPAPPLETLALHFCGELRLTHWYRRAAHWHTEPVIGAIYGLLARDEARHAWAYRQYMARALERWGDQARMAFAKIGTLMVSSVRSRKPLHPTNVHVNKSMFPRDTVQSKLPDRDWLERWLDKQIKFDRACEAKVIQVILRNLSRLLGHPMETVQDLYRYRKDIGKSSEVFTVVAQEVFAKTNVA